MYYNVFFPIERQFVFFIENTAHRNKKKKRQLFIPL